MNPVGRFRRVRAEKGRNSIANLGARIGVPIGSSSTGPEHRLHVALGERGGGGMNPVGRFRRVVAEKGRNPIIANLGARIAALVALSLSSLLVARTGGPALVGVFVLLRLLPWLMGVLLNFGLYGATPYFLAGPGRSERRYRSTIFAIALVSGVVGGLLWVAISPLLAGTLLSGMSPTLVALVGVTVLTQDMETTAKASSQGFDDLHGANRIIALEEITFLPFYLAFLAFGVQKQVAIVAALPLGDLCTGLSGWVRLARRGFFHAVGRPSVRLARRVMAYGFRAEIGSVVLLLNARLDFALVGGLVGPAALGIYAVASRFAELLRLPYLAVSYVLYPTYARDGREAAAPKARSMMRRVGWVPAAVAIPLGIAATFLLPWLFGPAFQLAVKPTYVLLIGLSGTGFAGVVTAFLLGAGRPGLNSLANGVGLVVTVTLDLLLIPRFGVMGAAVASSCAYLTTAFVLLAFFRVVARPTADWVGRGPVLQENRVREVSG
jgi:O-antigen/teichoic acid export membrane protein